VQAAQCLQRRVVQRLHAERDAVDTGGTIAAKARRLDAGRIGLERDLDVARDMPVPTVCGCISDGVPPPRKIEVTSRPGTRAAVVSISRAKARTKRASSTGACRTWLLKSQYGHFDRQNGQCT
jgi:hypothetical protein